MKQKLFCQYYLWHAKGNGTEAVIQAGYEVKKKNGEIDRNLAKSIASENLTKPDILKYLNSLLETEVLNEQIVTVQLAALINQWADLPVKVRAIDVYYRLKGMYAATKVEQNNPELETKIDDALNRLKKIIPASGV